MEKYIIASKLTILTYCMMKFLNIFVNGSYENSVYLPEVVIVVLAYICLSFAIYITNSSLLRKIIVALSIILITVCYRNINELFVLVLPINIFELVLMITDNLWLAGIMIEIPLFAISESSIIEYIMVSALSLVIYLVTYRYYKRVEYLLKERNNMREVIQELSARLNKDIDYEQQVRYSSQLEERNKISQEIHDRIGHSMSGSLIQLEAADIFLEKDPAKSREIIRRVINILREGTESIRITLRNMKPPVEQIGINRIKLILDEFMVVHNVKTTLMHSGNIEEISHLQWKIINENITEALTNVLKYSYATSVKVNIQVLNKFIKTEIRDNGIGAPTFTKGLGIRGIEERSGSSGGKVIIDGSDGFSIIILLPVESNK